MTVTASLLQTKLSRPSIYGPILRRHRLMERLGRCLNFPLTLILAPAGYGKTTLIAEWTRDVPFPTTWVALDRHDSDTRQFWSYIVSALTSLYPSLRDIAAMPVETPEERITIGIAILNHIKAEGGESVIILDDYHAIDDANTHRELQFVLDRVPSNLHVLLASRAEPPFSLARSRAYGGLLEVCTDDLRFTEAETAMFLTEILDLTLKPSEIALLAERTEGWAVGLRLTGKALSRQPGQADFTQMISACRRPVADYLIREVLSRESQDIQSFVLHTVILDRFSASLCAALLDEADSDEEVGRQASIARAQAALEYLEAKTLFVVPLDSERRWYRYHRLFADAMRDQLQRQSPGCFSNLHRTASAWYAVNGYATEAANHVLAAGRQATEKSEQCSTLAALDALKPVVARPRRSPLDPPIEALSARELEVLRCVAHGMSNHATAAQLNLAPSTVKWHLEQIYAKLNAHSRTQAIAMARGLHLID